MICWVAGNKKMSVTAARVAAMNASCGAPRVPDRCSEMQRTGGENGGKQTEVSRVPANRASYVTPHEFAAGSFPNGGGIPFGVFALGIVSFLTDVSSETIFAVLPIYFISVIGGSALVLGIMEGLADFAASSLDLASGYASDRTGKHKWLAFSGYALSTLAKSLLLLVSSVAGVVAFRVIERLGKSVRGAPRDALLAAMAPKEKRGVSFGIHKALD